MSHLSCDKGGEHESDEKTDDDEAERGGDRGGGHHAGYGGQQEEGSTISGTNKIADGTCIYGKGHSVSSFL